MAIRERMSGNEAVAHAIKQINPDVMAAFPITPSTEIPQMVSTFIANGDIDTEFIPVESEHSSMSATMGACAAGARAITATSSCGLATCGKFCMLPLPIVFQSLWRLNRDINRTDQHQL